MAGPDRVALLPGLVLGFAGGPVGVLTRGVR
jgi:hypothetical protein